MNQERKKWRVCGLKCEAPKAWKRGKELFYVTRCGWAVGFCRFGYDVQGTLFAGSPTSEGHSMNWLWHGRVFNGHLSPFDIVGVWTGEKKK